MRNNSWTNGSFFKTHPNQVLTIPIDSWAPKHLGTIFRIQNGHRSRSHAPTRVASLRRVRPTRSHAPHARLEVRDAWVHAQASAPTCWSASDPCLPRQLHVDQQDTDTWPSPPPVLPRHHFCLSSPDFV